MNGVRLGGQDITHRENILCPFQGSSCASNCSPCRLQNKLPEDIVHDIIRGAVEACNDSNDCLASARVHKIPGKLQTAAASHRDTSGL